MTSPLRQYIPDPKLPPSIPESRGKNRRILDQTCSAMPSSMGYDDNLGIKIFLKFVFIKSNLRITPWSSSRSTFFEKILSLYNILIASVL